MKNWTQRAKEVAQNILTEEFGPDKPSGWVYSERSFDGMGHNHLRWMLEELAKGQMSPTKACRWLGFAQALMLIYGISSLDREKARNQASGDRLPGQPYSPRIRVDLRTANSAVSFELSNVRPLHASDGTLDGYAGSHLLEASLERLVPAERKKEFGAATAQFFAERAYSTSDLDVVRHILDACAERKLNGTFVQRGTMYYLSLEL